MKKSKIIMGLSALLVVSLIATGCGKDIEVKNGSKVAVSVKGDKFTATEYYEKIKEKNIITLIDMIDHSILDKKYKSDDEEKEAIDKQIEQIKSYYGEDEKTFNSVIKQYFGAEDEDDLRNILSLEYKRNKAVEEYVEKNIKDDEIEKYYNENIFGEIRASHILITPTYKDDYTDEEKAKADEKALETAKKVIRELNSGKKFKDLAKKYSQDKSNASNGGDLGYFQLSDMVEEFSNAVRELKKDEYTKEPVKTQYGYHIILKTGDKDRPTLKDAKAEIKEKIRTQKLNEDKSLYYEALKEIRVENKIKWNDDTLKKAYDEYMKELIKASKENS